jgi:hypothetical protein
MKITNKMQLCRIIYYSLAALHVWANIFAHRQEHINFITTSGITHVCRRRLVSWECCSDCRERNVLDMKCFAFLFNFKPKLLSLH